MKAPKPYIPLHSYNGLFIAIYGPQHRHAEKSTVVVANITVKYLFFLDCNTDNTTNAHNMTAKKNKPF